MNRDQIRAVVPELAEDIDNVRAVFPGAKVTYLKIDSLGVEHGTPVNPDQCAMVDSTPMWKLKEQWKVEEKAQQEEIKRQFKRKKK